MRLALYHPWIYLRGGGERMLLETLNRSRHDWTVWTHRYEPEHTFSGFAHHDVREFKRVSVQRSLAPLMGASATIMRTRLPDEGYQALLVSSEGLGDFVVARNRLPAAAYCHTPLKILHDPVTHAALRQRGRKQAVALSLLGPAFNAVDRRMWRRYRHVFVNSTETMSRCERAGLAPRGSMDLLYPGVDLHRFFDDGAPREPFLLVAGRIMWQKNVELAIDTVRELGRQERPIKLVIAGAVDEKSKPYLAELRQRAAGLDVEFRVDPDDEELASLYRRCQLLLYTPPNEDFGIVPLEAMASGAPVVAVDSGGPRETVVDGESGWLVPAEVGAFADIVAATLDSPGRMDYMRKQARRRALWFNWDRVAARIDDVMEELALGRRPESEPTPLPRVLPEPEVVPICLGGVRGVPPEPRRIPAARTDIVLP